MIKIVDIAREAMDMLLVGDEDILKLLKIQYDSCELKIDEQFATGAYMNFENHENKCKVNPQTFCIDDVFLAHNELQYPIGFILFIKFGCLSLLEMHTYGDDKMPENFENSTFYYSKDGNIGDGKRSWAT